MHMKPWTKHVTVRIPTLLVELADKQAEKEHRTFSGQINHILMVWFGREGMKK